MTTSIISAAVASANAAEGSDAIAVFNLDTPLPTASNIVVRMSEWNGASGADHGPLQYQLSGQSSWTSITSGSTLQLPVGTTGVKLKTALLTDSLTNEAGESLNFSVQQAADATGLTNSWFVASRVDIADAPAPAPTPAPAPSPTPAPSPSPSPSPSPAPAPTGPSTITAAVASAGAAEGSDAIAVFNLDTPLPTASNIVVRMSEWNGASGADHGPLQYQLSGQSSWTTITSGSTLQLPVGTTSVKLKAALLTDSLTNEAGESLNFSVQQAADAAGLTNSWFVASRVDIAEAVAPAPTPAPSPAPAPAPVSTTLVAQGLRSDVGYELFKVNTTTGEASLVKDIASGPTSSRPDYVTALGNGKAVFRASDGFYFNNDLWVTDGTEAGTVMIKDIAATDQLQSIAELGNGQAVFRVASSNNGNLDLWITDGTASGTTLLKSMAAQGWMGNEGSRKLTSLGSGKIVFSGYDATHGSEMWVTDGTASGTVMLKEFSPGATDGSFGGFTALGNGKAVFYGRDSTTSGAVRLWVTDGTESGTHVVGESVQGVSADYVVDISLLGNGKAVFTALDAQHGTQDMWVTDGTAAGTTAIGSANSLVAFFVPLGNSKAVFERFDGSRYDLWVTDGTADGTQLAKDWNSSAFIPVASVYGGLAEIFGADGSPYYLTDGTDSGTVPRDISGPSASSSPLIYTADLYQGFLKSVAALLTNTVAPAGPSIITAAVASATAAEGTDALATFNLNHALETASNIVVRMSEWNGASGADHGPLQYQLSGQSSWTSITTGSTLQLPVGTTSVKLKAALLTDSLINEAGESLNFSVQQAADAAGLTSSWFVASLVGIVEPASQSLI